MRAAVLLGVALLAVATACGSGSGRGGDTTLRVFASASLTEAMGAIEDAFESGHAGVDVELVLAGTPDLVRQLAQGAPAGVFASADVESMEEVAGRELVAGEPRVFAHNVLELVVAPGNPHGVTRLTDLARPELVVALAAPEVPAGRYGERALAAAGVDAEPDTFEASVKAIVGKVALGEVDVGLVYRTDVVAADASVDGVAIPAERNVRAELTIAPLEGGGDAARRFVDFVLSPDGRRILTAAGFEVHR